MNKKYKNLLLSVVILFAYIITSRLVSKSIELTKESLMYSDIVFGFLFVVLSVTLVRTSLLGPRTQESEDSVVTTGLIADITKGITSIFK